jgi:hypothetical protein
MHSSSHPFGHIQLRKTGPFAHARASCICGAWESRWSRRLLVVTGARCPLTKPVVAAVELRVDHRAPLQPRRPSRRYLRVRGTARADSRRSGVGLAPGPQALPMPAAALVLAVPQWLPVPAAASPTARDLREKALMAISSGLGSAKEGSNPRRLRWDYK